MLHVLQSLKDGTTQLVDAPAPEARGASIVVAARASVVSAGTERMLVEFGRAGLLGKVRSQPDKVQQVLKKVRTDGLATTIDAVRSKLGTPIPLGYCHAGVVVGVGAEVTRFAVGDRVVTNGPHAECVSVAETLAARIPANVSFEAAAFSPLAAIGLQGLRLAAPTLGETIVVYGLGLIGLLTVQLARANGCRVIGIDRSAARCALAEQFGAEAVLAGEDVDVAAAVLGRTDGVGTDAVLLTLTTDSSDPVRAAAEMSRKRGRIVLVGVSGLELRRDDFYRKELSFQVSCSYGPGRYDSVHEQRGIDYPLPFVRWTEGRNFAAVLELMGQERLDALPLISHRFPIADAIAAYDVVGSGVESLGIVLTYPERDVTSGPASRTVELRNATSRPSTATIGWIGAGQFSTRVLMRAFKRGGAVLETVASASGVSASIAGKEMGFRLATSDVGAILTDPAIDTVVVATRHDSHAKLVTRSLDAGKHVFCEKPLALTIEELDRVADSASRAGRLLCVGFNRRFAPQVRALTERTAKRAGPLAISITVNAGAISRDHWTQDPATGGGRIVGEACHFIDLARAFTRTPIVTLQVVAARTATQRVSDDVALVQLSFADGSIAAIQYLANGHSGYPKERVELFWDGQIASIDNFRTMSGWGVRVPRQWAGRQDKGHAALAGAFVQAVRTGASSPIPLDELIEVSRVSVYAAEFARSGGGAMSFDR